MLDGGATVIIPPRSSDHLNDFREYLGSPDANDLVTLVGDVGQVEGAEVIRDEVFDRFERIDAVVASLGGGGR